MSFARLVVLLAALPPAAALAQVEAPPVTYPKLVAQAASAEAFAPAGWRVEFKTWGDLNADGRDDLALVLRQQNPANVLDNSAGLGPPRLDTNPRILAVAFGRASGGYVLALENHSLIPRTTQPTLDDFLAEGGGISIARRTLRVKLHLFASAGGWTAGSIGYVFRFRRGGRFVLIGYDSDLTQRNTGRTTARSINYTTGRMKLTTGSIENNAVEVEWKTLPRRPLLSIDQTGDGLAFDPDAPQAKR